MGTMWFQGWNLGLSFVEQLFSIFLIENHILSCPSGVKLPPKNEASVLTESPVLNRNQAVGQMA